MARLRIALALLAAAILAAAGLLAGRALRAGEVERAARHETLAERLFDEMERSLSAFLQREEERPYGAYAETIAAEPDAPFVVGWFRIEPDGSVRTAGPASGEVAARVRAIVEASLSEAVLPRYDEKADARPKDAPAPAPAAVAKKQAAPGASAYDMLQSLNRAATERQLRERKVWVAVGKEEGSGSRREARAGAPAEASEAPAAAPPAAGAVAPARDALAGRAQPIRVAVDPFVGRRAGDDLLLLRTVLEGGRGHRQGLVVDVPRLARHLYEQSLATLALPGARLAFAGGDRFEVGSVGARPFTFSHRFAEPFDALSAELALAPLPDGPGERSVLALAALLVLSAAVGLSAVYRMVAVRLAFAQRRSNFAAAVSHELKTPLTAIRMYVEMLRDGLVDSEAKRREYYATLGAESERLSRLIDNVLEFSRLERGTRRIELRAAPLGPEVLERAALLRPHAEREGFALRVEVEPGLPPVRFERDALAQILFNLVENALKYAKRAALRRVDVACRSAGGGGVALLVRDHGPGVPERRLARIFEPFYRGEDELTRETQGSGIGLALVKGLADRMGARVSARNAPGGGLEVELRFSSSAYAALGPPVTGVVTL